MLTHKIRDMFGNSNSGDESRMSSNGGCNSDSQSNNNNQQINFAIKLEKSRSPMCDDDNNATKNGDDMDEDDNDDDEDIVKENGMTKESTSDFAFKRDSDIKKWCNKLNEMPENIAAS
jgi:hypothetical protein